MALRGQAPRQDHFPHTLLKFSVFSARDLLLEVRVSESALAEVVP
jgi:hypothetical protein